MRYRGLFDARPEDWIGFGLTWIDMSSHYARNQRYMNQSAAPPTITIRLTSRWPVIR
jgi:carbohydrate-selective porin OprB